MTDYDGSEPVTKPIPMKRELKDFPFFHSDSNSLCVTKPIPMKRELKVIVVLSRSPHSFRSFVTKPIPMKRELKGGVFALYAARRECHKANPDEKGTERSARLPDLSTAYAESQSQSR